MRLATGSSTSRQTRSTGCSSGEAGGRKTRSDAVGHDEPFRRVPARSVEDQHRPVPRVDPFIGGKGGQHLGHGLGDDGRHEAPPALARGGPHDGVHGEPLVAVAHPGGRPLAAPRPDPADDRQPPKAVLVLGPDGQLGRRMGCPDRIDLGLEPPFLKAAWATGSAVVLRGRGR